MNEADPKADSHFLSEEISMLATSEGGDPIRFCWRGSEHVVVEVLVSWQDWGFSPVAAKRDWKNRRHRNYYQVETDTGWLATLYFDRGFKPSHPRKWILLEGHRS